MANVYMPKKNDQTSQALGLGGAVAGGIFGGPSGAMAGMSAGNTIGGIASKQGGAQTVGTDDQSAMQRRMMAQQNDRLKSLRDAVTALPELPPDVRQEYARPVMTAYVAEAKQRGVNPWEGMEA